MTSTSTPDALPASKEAEAVREIAHGEDDMPERIWAGDFDEQGFGHCVAGMQGGLYSEYVRSDIAHPPTDAGVSEEMVERARNAILNANVFVSIEHMRAALRAALSIDAMLSTASTSGKG